LKQAKLILEIHGIAGIKERVKSVLGKMTILAKKGKEQKLKYQFRYKKRKKMINVLITDDHPVVRRGIRQILEDDDRISLVQEAGNGRNCLKG